jgi:CheY-like chemotaxis protein
MTNKTNNYSYPHCILIADDDRDDQDMLHEALTEQQLNTHIDTVDNGVELLEYIGIAAEKKTKPFPCLIILDINMPKKNGMEALKEIRKISDYNDIAVIMYSTSRSEETKMDCHLIGANTYISQAGKPERAQRSGPVYPQLLDQPGRAFSLI